MIQHTDHHLPRPVTGGELKRVIEAERCGDPFLLYRDDHDELRIAHLPVDGTDATVGRRGTNHLSLPWDGEVSRVHAVLECIGGVWMIADDGVSRNGTFVNGNRITTRHRLADKDAIRVGTSLIVFRRPDREASTRTRPPSERFQGADVTPTQRRILVALCRPFGQGGEFATPATNHQIASEVFLSVDGIKTHMRALFAKFGVGDLPQNQKRARLVELALKHGVVTERDF